MDHECRTFQVRSSSHYVEHDGLGWVLHVLGVEGEEDDIYIALNLSGREEYVRFLKDFPDYLVLTRAEHPDASTCPECRTQDRDDWLVSFSEWVQAAYSAMDTPPVPVKGDLPPVVQCTFDSILGAQDGHDVSSMN